MGMLIRTAVVGAIGVVAWEAWQRYRSAHLPVSVHDDGGFTPSHGDPRVPAVEIDMTTPLRAAAHSSRGFGGED